MPHAIFCLDCKKVTTEGLKGRCPDCRSRKNAADPYQSPGWRRLSKEARDLYGCCAICGSTKRLTAHHRRPRKEGGTDTLDNLLLLCGTGAIGMEWRSCHGQYEADLRTGKDTWLTRTVAALSPTHDL